MRNSVIELLRIVMMCFIVVHHIILAKYSGFYDLNQEYDISRVAYLSLDSFLFVGVNVFALISGYYAVKMGGVIRYYFYCFFYGLIAYLFHVCIDDANIGLSLFTNSVLCFSNCHWWYAEAYLYLIFFSPIYNIVISKINKQNHLKLLLILTVITVYFGFIQDAGINKNGYNFIQLSYMYFIGRYINLYISYEDIVTHRYRNLLMYIILSVILAVVAYLNFYVLNIDFGVMKPMTYNNPILILSSIFLFVFFISFQFNSKLINHVAKSSFAIYLLHQHYYTRTFIFSNSVIEHYNIVEILMSIVFIAILIDQLRIVISNFIFTRFKNIHDKVINYITFL